MHCRLAISGLLGFVIACGGATSPEPTNVPLPVGRDSASTALFARIGRTPWGAEQIPTDILMSGTLPGPGRVLGSLTGGPFKNFVFVDLPSTRTGTYSLANGTGATGYVTIRPESGNLDSIYSYQSLRGEVIITRSDTAGGYIEGTFWYDAAPTGAGPNGVLRVTNGVFRGVVRDTSASGHISTRSSANHRMQLSKRGGPPGQF